MNQASSPPQSDHARLRVQWERFQDVANELLVLTQRQQAEVGKNYQPYNPDWARYFSMDRAGSCAVWTARSANRTLCGYVLWLTFRGMHCVDTVFASADLIYMAPEWRDGLRGYKFIKSSIDAVKQRNPDIIHIETNFLYKGGKLGNLLARLGLTKIGEVYEWRSQRTD